MPWLGDAPSATPLLVREIRAGFNVPGVIRLPAENVVRHTLGAHLVRVDPDHPEPTDLETRAPSVPCKANRLLNPLTGSDVSHDRID